MEELISHIEHATPAICIAMSGALIQAFKGGWRGWKNLIASELAAGFGAYVAWEVCQDYSILHGMQVFIYGMIGWSGGTLMDGVLERFERKLRGDGDDGGVSPQEHGKDRQ